MAYFAILNENNIVTNVVKVSNNIAITEEAGITFLKNIYKNENLKALQTSYNTYQGVHLNPLNRQPDGGTPIRGNYAEIGFIYNEEDDFFHKPRPLDRNGLLCNSWNLSRLIYDWKPPVAYPNIENTIFYWDEPTLSWVETPIEE
jgi:hypothetical protein